MLATFVSLNKFIMKIDSVIYLIILLMYYKYYYFIYIFGQSLLSFTSYVCCYEKRVGQTLLSLIRFIENASNICISK
jgi:hypothetical protein